MNAISVEAGAAGVERPPGRFHCRIKVRRGHEGEAVAVIGAVSGLSKNKVKEAMAKGAVRLRRGGLRRVLRRATFALRAGDVVDLYYDPQILAASAPEARCLADEGAYSVWCKPPGLLAEGTLYGDHCTLVRQAERRLGPGRAIHLVHRLDREAAGLVILAHHPQAAAVLSRLFASARVTRRFLAQVLGEPAVTRGVIDQPLDGRQAYTQFTVLYRRQGRAVLDVGTRTLRRHQIRRHLADIGHPVLGDPAYGRGNKTPDGLQLVARMLAFPDPVTGVLRHYELAEPERGCHSALV